MKGLLAVGLGVAAFVAPAAIADPGQWSVTGSGVGTGVVAGDHVELGAHSDVGGANPRGHAENQGTLGSVQFNDGGPVVCLQVRGNRAVIVWKLREPQTLPGFVGEFGGAYVEDNGEPAGGEPVDRMADFSLRASTAQAFCETDLGFVLGSAFAEPLASGNFVVRES